MLLASNQTGDTVLASGPLPQQSSPWLELGLRFDGSNVTMLLDGEAVATALDDGARPAGMIGLGSGFHEAAFANVSVA